jgi:hypothetical protein
MDTPTGYWEQEGFADFVEKTLDVMGQPYGQMLGACKRLEKHYRISKKQWRGLRARGLYFPPDDEVVLNPVGDTTIWTQVTNYPITSSFSAPTNPDDSKSDDSFETIYRGIWIFKRHRLPKPYGISGEYKFAYEINILNILPTGKFITMRDCCVITEDHTIIPATSPTITVSPHSKISPEWAANENWAIGAGIALQVHEDRQRLWIVLAEGEDAASSFGVKIEQVKSLFYARSAPLTAAGRRRPILHWVDAHKRRLANGTEVDIAAHIRGVTEVEMGGTRFVITEPEKPHQAEHAMKVSPQPVALGKIPAAPTLSWTQRLWQRLKGRFAF